MGSLESEIDLNSGDIQGTQRMPDGSLRYGVYETELSREVRRLGIPIPKERKWGLLNKPYTPGSGAMEVYSIYSHLPSEVDRLLVLLKRMKATDEQRRAILERFITILRAEKPVAAVEKAHDLVVELETRRLQ